MRNSKRGKETRAETSKMEGCLRKAPNRWGWWFLFWRGWPQNALKFVQTKGGV